MSCATLQPAYDQSERRALVDHVSQCDFQSLEKCATHVPMDLRIIIHKCLEREPELRYQHAAALEEDLRRFLGWRAHPSTPCVSFGTRWTLEPSQQIVGKRCRGLGSGCLHFGDWWSHHGLHT